VPYDSRDTPPTLEEWSNGGTGGIKVTRNGVASIFTGKINTDKGKKGDKVISKTFRFSLLITPTRPLDLKKHYGERHYQAGGPVNYTAIAEGGATILVEHQGNVINPWINYGERAKRASLDEDENPSHY